MEFKFNPNLDYQLEAIQSTVDVFDGQRNTHENRQFVGEGGSVPNVLSIDDQRILNNLRNVQEENDIDPSDELESMTSTEEGGAYDFSIEMETGTGKTYVYLRTIHELFQKYGWKKFIVVVPSIAVKEGVLKTLQQTKQHFEALYDNTPLKYFEYDSDSLHRVKGFSTSNNIEVMVMTLQSINKGDDNVMYQHYDSLQGERPIDLVKKTNPILLLDEPQNMESETSKEALQSLDPLFTLRYSATHRNPYNLVYQLTPVDAYKRELVKQIDVLSVTKQNDLNTTYLKVLNIESDSRGPKARIELHIDQSGGIKTKKRTVRYDDDLYEKSKGVNRYRDITVTELDASKELIGFSDGTRLSSGESTDIDFETIQHHQIRETIKEHFEKAQELHERGIKVLSLFFIDEVSNYTDDDGHLREAFKKAFNELKSDPRYDELYGDVDPGDVTGSYFSEYKSESYIESDDEAYDLIMKDKEELLSLDNSVEFIFSHSALKEGWDNPNVFQICTLNNTVSKVKKRQEIGRGVRLAVNQEGERVHDNDVNVLTVVANESYADYVAALQTEYEETTGYEDSMSDRTENARDRTTVNPNTDKLESEEFEELWSRISPQTRYISKIESEEIIEEAAEEISNISVDEAHLQLERTSLQIEENNKNKDEEVSIRATSRRGEKVDLEKEVVVPDIVSELAEDTNLTKETIAKTLLEADVSKQILSNPEVFVTQARGIFKRTKENHVIENIEYEETGKSHPKAIVDEVKTYEEKTVPVENSVYEEIIWDSKGERDFAKRLDKKDEVLLFVKLPSGYKIPTPTGNYNPDWAIVYQEKDLQGDVQSEEVYLVRETKFLDEGEQRASETKKIKCAKKHYQVIGVDGVDYDVIRDIDADLVESD